MSLPGGGLLLLLSWPSHEHRKCTARGDGVLALVHVGAEVGSQLLGDVCQRLVILVMGEDGDAADFFLNVTVVLAAVLRLAAVLLLPELLAVSGVKGLVLGAHGRLVEGANG